MWGVERRAARGEAGAGWNKADGARSDVTGFRKIERVAYDVPDVPKRQAILKR